MGPSALFTLAVVLLTICTLVREWVAPSIAVVGAMTVLLVAGVVGPEEALAGFSNPAPITVAALFILARAVEKTGALQPIVRGILARGDGRRANLARILIPTAASSSLLNNTPIVAMLMPQVTAWADRMGKPVSWYLMPISFAAILGGMVTLIGTSTNLVVSGLLEEAGQAPLGMFEMTGVGLPAALVGLVVVAGLTPILLPERRGPKAAFEEEFREFTVQMEVIPGGAVDGLTVEAAGLRHLQGVFLARIERSDRVIAPVAPDEVLSGSDRLGFVGQVELVVDLHMVPGLRSSEHKHVRGFEDGDHAFHEAVVSSTSPLIGRTLKAAAFREQYQAAVMAIHRAGERVRSKLGEVTLRSGDTLLLLSDRGFGGRWRDRRDFLLVSRTSGRLPVESLAGAFVMASAVAVVLLAAMGLLSILKGALLAAILMVVSGVLTPNEARNAVDLDVILLIAAAFGVGNAIAVSGLADLAGGGIVGAASALGPIGVLTAVVLVTILLTELVTNNAAAILMFPIAIAAAASIDAEPRAFAIAVGLSASASFLSPVGYQTNMMVYGPGGYRFSDFARLGAPITLCVSTIIVLLVAVQWKLF